VYTRANPGASEREQKTVLVVEDSDDDLVVFKRMVRKSGCGLSFQYVDDGEKALAHLKGEGPYADRRAHPFPDLVILDLGWTALRCWSASGAYLDAKSLG
jgi:CheY-like chemotaxis protein